MCGNRSARRKTTEEEVSFSFRHLCLFDIFSLGGNRSARGKTTLPDTGKSWPMPGLGIRRAVVRSSCRLGPEHELARRLEGSEAAAVQDEDEAAAVVADEKPTGPEQELTRGRDGTKRRQMEKKHVLL